MRLVDRELERLGAGPDHGAPRRQRGHEVEVDLLVVEGHDAAALGEGPQVGGHEGRPEHHLGGHRRRRRRRRRSASTAMERPERAGRLARHAGQLARPDEPDGMGAQLARPRAGIRLDSGADTTGRLREEHHGHGQAAADREHDRRRQAAARRRGPAAAVRRGRARPRLRLADLRARRADPPGRRRLAGARHRPGHRRGAGAPAAPDDAGAAGPDRAVGDGRPAPPRHRPLAPGRGGGHVGHELRQAGPLHEGVPGVAHAAAAGRDGARAPASASRPTPSRRSRSPVRRRRSWSPRSAPPCSSWPARSPTAPSPG